jgi:hypothetical protein
MPSSRCKQCDQPLVEIDHWGERLTGCPNRLENGADWQLMTSWRYVHFKVIKPNWPFENDKAG